MKISRHKTPLGHRVKARTARRWLYSELLGPIAAAAIIGGRYASFCDDTIGLCGYQCGWTGTAGSTNGTKKHHEGSRSDQTAAVGAAHARQIRVFPRLSTWATTGEH